MMDRFRYAGADEYPRISRFLNDHWAQDHIYCRDRALFDWTFSPRDLWTDSACCFALGEDGEELAGILGGIPFRYNRYGAASLGVWIVNYVIRPDQRKGTAALKLLSMFRRPDMRAVVAFGITPATVPIYQVLRGDVLPAIPRHFVTLPDAGARAGALLRLAQPDWSEERAIHVADTFRAARIPAPPTSWRIGVPRDWDTRQWPAFAASTVGAARDMRYLEWRYLSHPRFQYHVATVDEGSRSGLLVWRIETIHHATASGRVAVDRIGRLVEFLPVSIDNARAMYALFLTRLRAAEALGADYYGFHGTTRAWLAELGFSTTDAHLDGAAIPSRFQPLDGKGGQILSAVFLQDRTPACSLAADCPWYWTKSDSDQDRPN